MWTRFMDMHSGGGSKEKWSNIYIEATIDEAKIIFYNKFGHNPERVTCTCCGEDYSIYKAETLEQITGYKRCCNYIDGKYIEEQGKDYGHYQTLSEYEKNKDVLIIRKQDIKPHEYIGEVPRQGYVWRD